MSDLRIEKSIQHYRIELSWSDHSHSPVGTWRVAAYPAATGGRWSDYCLTVEEAVTNCLEKNRLSPAH